MFNGVPRKTIESCMRNLALALVQSSGDIQYSIRRLGPHLANLRVFYSHLIEKGTFSRLITNCTCNENELSRKRIYINKSAFSKVERHFNEDPSSKLSALSYEKGINQSSPGATISNSSIDHILQTGETATKSSLIHKATPREESSTEVECNNPHFQLMEEDLSILHSSDELTDDRVITLLLRKQKLNISAFQDVIASVHR